MKCQTLVLFSLATSSASISLRGEHVEAKPSKGIHNASKHRRTPCGGGLQPAGLLEVNVTTPTATAGGVVYADGFSRIACEFDAAPETQRISFKEHACGGEVKSCRLTTLPMTPRLCFDFCRKYEQALFFGLVHGRDCYCSTYFTAHSTGAGECDRQCEGDAKEMCGGKVKSSLFEMHSCGNSANEASDALELSLEATSAGLQISTAANSLAEKLRELASSWNLGVCSVEPEGPRVCGLTKIWLAQAAAASDAGAKVEHANDVLEKKDEELRDLSDAADIAAEGKGMNATLASGLELTTADVRGLATKADGIHATSNLTLKALAGPLSGEALSTFSKNYKPLGVDGKSAVCALVPMKGKEFAALAGDSPAACANECMSKSVGKGGCVAFNYQYRDGLATCQLLTDGGLVTPRLSKAIPVFAVPSATRKSMDIAALDCYASNAFTAGHPQGPLKAEVIREVAGAEKAEK